MTTGYLHSLESFGAVDGPGIRFVVFLSGCPLRCLYCHNPDTWVQKQTLCMTPPEVMEKIRSERSFLLRGGVTLSGGEPLMQAEFCAELLTLCRQEGFHTAIDTSGAIPLEQSRHAIDLADMLLLDIKDIDPEDCRTLTGKTNENALATLDYCEQTGKDVWIRHVLVPVYTLNPDKLQRLADKLSRYSCVKRVDLLPYHTMGLYKWESLGLTCKLADTPTPTAEEIAMANAYFTKWKTPAAE